MSIALNLAASRGHRIAVSTTSVQSPQITGSIAVVHTSVDCYIRQGYDPVAVADGTDLFVPAGAYVRLSGINTGNRLAIIATAPGTVHLMPGA